jgi:putative hydrolase of the HAD superfamily
MIQNPKGVFLDMDDTILADDSVNEIAWKIVCERYSRLIGRVTPAELREIIRKVTTAYWADPERHRVGRLNLYQTRRELLAQAIIGASLGEAELGYEMGDFYSAEKDRMIRPVEGAIETLNRLRARGIPLVLVTNGGSDMQRAKIDRFKLEPFFKLILIEGEFGVGKPDARVFQAGLDSLGLKPSECWMVGDDLNRDIGGAMQLGIIAVWIDKQGSGLPSDSNVQPDRIIRNIGELLQ